MKSKKTRIFKKMIITAAAAAACAAGVYLIFNVNHAEYVEDVSPEELRKAYELLAGSLVSSDYTYTDYLKYLDAGYGEESCSASPKQGEVKSFEAEGELPAYEGSAVVLNYEQTAEYRINVGKRGVYYLAVDYLSAGNSYLDYTVDVALNGEVQYQEWRTVELPLYWQDAVEEYLVDRYGDEIAPAQERLNQWNHTWLYNNTYSSTHPLYMTLEAGENVITLTNRSNDGLALGTLYVEAPAEECPSYEEYSAQYTDVAIAKKGAMIPIGATDYTVKNSAEIIYQSTANPSMTPYDPEYKKLNTLSWTKPGNEITYEFGVQKEGMYQLGFHYMNDKEEFNSYESIAIDGKVPFQELQCYAFPYSNGGWANEVLSDEKGNPYYIYLSEGSHVLTIKTEMEPVTEAWRYGQLIAEHVTQFSLDIKKISGQDADKYRTWKMTQYIPEIPEYLDAYMTLIQHIRYLLQHESEYGINGALLSYLDKAEVFIRDMAEYPDEIALYTTSLTGADNSVLVAVSKFTSSIMNVKFSLDMIYAFGEDKLPAPRAGVFKNMGNGLATVYYSFTSDKYKTSSEEDDELNIWVSRALTHVDLLQKLADTEFTPKTGIKVKISVMPDANKLTLASAADQTPDIALGLISHMVNAVTFREEGLKGVLAKEQCFANKVPCGFIPVKTVLAAGEICEFTAFSGFASSVDLLNEKAGSFCAKGYVKRKMEEARELVSAFTKDVWTRSANPLFDQYMEQCYLDNFLRGGIPFVMGKGENKAVVHLFSRKHGDPERDYNFFSIAGEYYSQGNGNYRDVCQNRRNDVFFHPAIGDFNVRHFYSLVQMDGYNPLEIRPCTFVIPEENKSAAAELIAEHVEDPAGRIAGVLSKPFTPGQVTNAIAAHQLKVKGDEEELVNGLIGLGREQIEAGFGEGYWSDHWDYNLDLVENFLLVYPDRRESLLFGDDSYGFYDSVGVVRPRSETYVINKGKVRQYGSMYHCKEKAARPGFVDNGTNWLKDRQGNKVTTTLFGKMMTLAVNKFALLDSFGMGIEMEGGKPGWNDAMNGLPGLFGSGMPETLELKRLVDFLLEEVKRHSPEEETGLPLELSAFMQDIYALLQEELSDFEYWDRTASRRERFREEIKFEVSGGVTAVSFRKLEEILTAFGEKLERGIARALAYGQGIMPTYFTFEAAEYEPILNEDGTPRISPYGLPAAHVKSFSLVQLPFFLEGPARMLSARGRKDRKTAEEMCDKIRETDIYDRKLKMYKTSESIQGISMENGRVRAFTPGWLERESVFLHMEYKYFLGMLKAGLYDRFYEAVNDALIPYQNPEMYGRSILENSSFLASSANPDPSVHGQGFVARLSGSTVEMLSMWLGMFLGEGGFTFEGEKLGFSLAPRLSGDMFDERKEASFMLLGSCRVTYHNESAKNTYGGDGVKVRRMELTEGSDRYAVEGGILGEEPARKLREGKISEIHAWLG